jgi:hypothetical protein
MKIDLAIRFAVLAPILFLLSCSSSSDLFSRGDVSDIYFLREIPVDRVSKVMIVEVDIEGESYRFLFDTGAPNVIDEDLAERLGLKTIYRSKVSDSQGKAEKLEYVQIPYLSLGGIPFEGTTSLVADLKAAPEIACLKVDGIIGANLMKLVYWKLDAQHGKIIFTNRRDSLKIPENTMEIAFRTKSTYTPKVHIKVGNLQVYNATFDTGSGGLLSLYRKWFDLDSIPNRSSYGYHSAGLYGSRMDSLWYTELQIGFDTIIPGQRTELIRLTETKSALLGMEYLERYVIYMDWEDRVIHLKEQENPFISHPSTYGFIPRFMDGKLRIGAVLKESKLDSTGVQVGEVIESINGMPGGQIELSSYCDLRELLKHFNGELNIQIEGRDPIRIQREPFFTN